MRRRPYHKHKPSIADRIRQKYGVGLDRSFSAIAQEFHVSEGHVSLALWGCYPKGYSRRFTHTTGFHGMSKAQHRLIAAQGGKKAQALGHAHRWNAQEASAASKKAHHPGRPGGNPHLGEIAKAYHAKRRALKVAKAAGERIEEVLS